VVSALLQIWNVFVLGAEQLAVWHPSELPQPDEPAASKSAAKSGKSAAGRSAAGSASKRCPMR